MPPSPFPLPQRACQFYFQQAHTLAGFPSQLLADVSYLRIMEQQETHLFLRSQFREKPRKGEEGQCGSPKQVLTFMEDVLAQLEDCAGETVGFPANKEGAASPRLSSWFTSRCAGCL